MHRLAALSLMFGLASHASGVGINADTALAPGKGQYIHRAQLRYLRSTGTPSPIDLDLSLLASPQVLVYGVEEDLSLFGVVPFLRREGTLRSPGAPGASVDLDETGVADLTFFAKKRIFREDEPGRTRRTGLLGGLEIPSGDPDFSSDSLDPFLGLVHSRHGLEDGLDLDAVWKFNTGSGIRRHDELRYDAAYSRTLILDPGREVSRPWQLNGLLELNGSYLTDGSHLLFISPGLQLALTDLILETSFQVPLVRDLVNGVEPDFVLVTGFRRTW